MIPTKLLVYRRTPSDIILEPSQETRRRKKSCGELFQNGYRVRQIHRGPREPESQTGLFHSVRSCLNTLSNWSKDICISIKLNLFIRRDDLFSCFNVTVCWDLAGVCNVVGIYSRHCKQ